MRLKKATSYTGKHSSMCWGWAIRYPSVFCRSLNLIFSGFSSLIYLKIVALFPFSFQWWILYFDVVCCLYFDGICMSGLTMFSTQISSAWFFQNLSIRPANGIYSQFGSENFTDELGETSRRPGWSYVVGLSDEDTCFYIKMRKTSFSRLWKYKSWIES